MKRIIIAGYCCLCITVAGMSQSRDELHRDIKSGVSKMNKEFAKEDGELTTAWRNTVINFGREINQMYGKSTMSLPNVYIINAKAGEFKDNPTLKKAYFPDRTTCDKGIVELSKKMDYAWKQYLVRNNSKSGANMVRNVQNICYCVPINNPNYNPNQSSSANDQPETTQGYNNSDDSFDSPFGASTQYDNFFDAPSARDRIIAQGNTESNAPETDLSELDKYLNSNAVTIVGTTVNTQSDDKLTPLTAGGTHGNIFLKGQETEDLYEQLELEEYIRRKSELTQRELQRTEDLLWYEKMTPWYDKKIDRFHTQESRDFSDYLIVGGAYISKGFVIASDKGSELVVGGGTKLITGQAQKELKEGTIIALDAFTKGKIGKDEVNAAKGYGETMMNHHFSFQKDGGKKIVEAIDNPSVYLREQKKLEEGMKKTADDYLQTKGYVTPQKVTGTIEKEINSLEPKNIAIKEVNKWKDERIEKMPDSEIKQSYLNFSNNDYSFLKLHSSLQIKKEKNEK